MMGDRASPPPPAAGGERTAITLDTGERAKPADADIASGLPAPGSEVLGGKYVIERVIASGGMGVVALAEQRGLRRRVAFKFLRKALTSNEAIAARFLREGSLLASLRSEHVARVLDVGVLDSGVHYLIMEHLEGADVGKLLERGSLPLERAVDFVLQACEALAEAHAAGIVHRDIKPSNLFVTRRADGSDLVKVIDFGISKAPAADAASEPDPQLTYDGEMLGSPSYMSPEQVRNSTQVDPRTDVWALGITLLEMCTGMRPFRRATFAATCAAIVADPLPDVRSKQRELPPALADIILRCLEKSPERRFADVASLAAALAPFGSLDARTHARRAARLLSGRVFASSDSTLATSPDPRRSGPDTTIGSSSSAQDTSAAHVAAQRPWKRIVFGAALLVTVVVAAIAALARPTTPAPTMERATASGPSTQSAPAPAPIVAAPSEPGAASSQAPAPTPTPSATASSGEPKASPRTTPRTAPATNVARGARSTAGPAATPSAAPAASAPTHSEADLLRQRR